MTTVGTHLIRFDGDKSPEEVTSVSDAWTLTMIEIGNQSYYLAADSDEAGEAVRERYRDMDRRELRELIGDDRLISWGLGESDEYGIRSLDDFIDAVGRVPEEDLASYDGTERDARINVPLAGELGWGTYDDELDADALAESIGIGDVEIPDSIRAAYPGLSTEWRDMSDDDAKRWAQILIDAESHPDADQDAITEILDTFRFIRCVAYRHN